MTMQDGAKPTTWRVTSQSQTTQINGAGAPVDGVEVFFTTGDGHSGSVFVAQNQYNPANVRDAIAAAATQMDAVGQLTSES